MAQDTVGWPVYVRQIAAVCRTPPGGARHRTAIVASNYGEQDEPVAVCRDPIGGWQRVWPALRHED